MSSTNIQNLIQHVIENQATVIPKDTGTTQNCNNNIMQTNNSNPKENILDIEDDYQNALKEFKALDQEEDVNNNERDNSSEANLEQNTRSATISNSDGTKTVNTYSTIILSNGKRIEVVSESSTLDKSGNLLNTNFHKFYPNGKVKYNSSTTYNGGVAEKTTEEYITEDKETNRKVITNYNEYGRATEIKDYSYNNGQKVSLSRTQLNHDGTFSTGNYSYNRDNNNEEIRLLNKVTDYTKDGNIKKVKINSYDSENNLVGYQSLAYSNNFLPTVNEYKVDNEVEKLISSTEYINVDFGQTKVIKKDENGFILSSSIVDTNELINSGLGKEILQNKSESEYLCERFGLNKGQLDKIIENGDAKYLYYILNDTNIDMSKIGSSKYNSVINNEGQKLMNALLNGKDIEEAFCPTYKSTSEAESSTKVGDTCVIDNKLYIKSNTGELKELNMSRETYLDLFPPVSKYAMYQQKSGDCYLISTLYDMETTPNTKEHLLNCFTENSDGSVTVKLPKGIDGETDVSFTMRPGTTMDDYYTYNADGATHAKSCDGIRALEYVYGFTITTINADNLLNNLEDAIKSGDGERIRNAEVEYINGTNKAENDKGNGGLPLFVFECFGMNAYYQNYENRQENQKELFDLTADEISNALVIGGTYSGTDLSNISSINPKLNHAYAIKPQVGEDGNRTYEVLNPYNTTESVTLDYYELEEVFNGSYFIGNL